MPVFESAGTIGSRCRACCGKSTLPPCWRSHRPEDQPQFWQVNAASCGIHGDSISMSSLRYFLLHELTAMPQLQQQEHPDEISVIRRMHLLVSRPKPFEQIRTKVSSLPALAASKNVPRKVAQRFKLAEPHTVR